MKPTQQEIIDLAHEDSGHTYPEWLRFVPIFALERLVHLALERFGAGGEEPICHLMECKDIHGKPCFIQIDEPEGIDGVFPVYTRPSPTDLRAEYLRGLEDAKKEVEQFNVDGVGAIVDAIEALKGKQ